MRTRRSAVNREGVVARLGIVRLAFLFARINKQNENEHNRIGLFMLSNRFVSLYKTIGLGLLVLTLPGNRIGTCEEVERTSGSSSLPVPPDENKSIRLHPPGDGIAIG
jgi:hypothetical protein